MVEFKKKIACFADKVSNSKVYKGIEKVAVTAGAGLITAGTMAMTSFAESGVSTLVIAELKSKDIFDNALPFINAGIPILAAVGGLRLGVRFLRGAMH